jgi:hypothetical protein
VNTHPAMPLYPASLLILQSHSPSFPSRSRRRNLLHSFPSVILMRQGGNDWTGSRMHVLRQNVSPLNLARKPSLPTRMIAFSGSQIMAPTGSSPYVRLILPPLLNADLAEQIQPACPPTRTCKWRFNWLGTRHAGTSRLRTRLLSREPSTRLALRRSVP